MKYYMSIPNFRRLYETKGVNATKKIMCMLEEIRYMCYLTAYFEQGCVPITGIITHKSNTAYMQMLALLEKPTQNFEHIVLQLYNQITNSLFKVFCMQYKQFCKIQPYYASYKPDVAFKEVVLERCVDWDVFCYRAFYNEIENPSVVDRLLTNLFAADEKVLERTKYSIDMYDFGGYSIEFVTKKEMESFIEHFVEVGVAYTIEDGVRIELYTF